MTIILFLIDTSGSMNQRAHYGARPTLLDLTKETVEKFLKMRSRDVASRGDRYMLLTFDEVPNNIKAGWKENHSHFMTELKNLTATGMTTFGYALRNAFDYLNINRMQNGIDMYGQGRCPYYLEAAIIIAITDGATYSTTTNVQRELNLPVVNHCPGAEFTQEPFRWDQRLFSIVLRLSGTYSIEPNTKGSNGSMIVPCDNSQIQAMCEVTGGRSFSVTSMKALNASLEQLLSRMHIGVMIKFEKVGPDPLPVGNSNGQDEVTDRSWTSTRNLVYVRPGQKGYSVGNWPMPEAYWADVSMNSLPPRSAHPVVKFSCNLTEPAMIENLPFDKYELDPSPLTSYMLARKQPNVAWPVYVPNSLRNSELGAPFGYLKPSSNLNCVNLFILPYNYPILLPLLDELTRMHGGKPSREWKIQFDNYLKGMPLYYSPPLRRALQRMAANSSVLPENLDTYSNITVNNLIKKYKNLAKLELDKLAAMVSAPKPVNNEWPKPMNQPLISQSSRKPNSTDFCSNPSLKKQFFHLQSDPPDFNFVVRYTGQANSHAKVQHYRNPFDILRHDLIEQIYRLRRNFFQKQTSSIKYLDEDLVHNLPVSQMGNYQEYLKKLPAALRELEAAPTRHHIFGNPFKLDKKMMMIDEADIDLVVGNNGGNSSRGMKRTNSDPYMSGPKPKRKPGPLPKDFSYTRSSGSLSPYGGSSPAYSCPSPSPSPPQTPPPSTSGLYGPPPTNSAHYQPPYHGSSPYLNNHNSVLTNHKMAQSNGFYQSKSSPKGFPPSSTFNHNNVSHLSPVDYHQHQQQHIVGNFVNNGPLLNTSMQMTPLASDVHRTVSAVAILRQQQAQQANNHKKPPTLTNGKFPLNKFNNNNNNTNNKFTKLIEQNGVDNLCEFRVNYFRKKNLTSDEIEKKCRALELARTAGRDYSELLQHLSAIEDPFGQYVLLEVVSQARRFKKMSAIKALQNHPKFAMKIEKIMRNYDEDGQMKRFNEWPAKRKAN